MATITSATLVGISSSSSVQPPTCDDYTCCSILGHGQCPLPYTTCQTANSPGIQVVNGQAHPIQTCATCRRHEVADNQTDITGWASRQIPGPAGAAPTFHYNQAYFRSNLCSACIDREVKLYWARVAMHPAPVPTTYNPNTMRYLNQWPGRNAAGNPTIQDLCCCDGLRVQRMHQRCHACRDDELGKAIAIRTQNDDILRNYPATTITGRNRLSGKRKTRMRANTRTRREQQGIGRFCPCGKDPEIPRVNSAREYASFCLGCMGVRIVPANLPPALRALGMAQAPQVQTLRRSARLAAQAAARATVTYTPVFRHRHRPEQRVNIERAWLNVNTLLTD